jgi:hypothetical protein
MIQWKDETSYSREGSREPNCWAAKFGRFTLKVHRHIHYQPDDWLASCDNVFSQFLLKSKEIEQVKHEAIVKLRVVLEVALEDIGRLGGIGVRA